MSDIPKEYWLYVLKLEAGKYYIGVTAKSVQERFKEHQNGFYAAEWTKIHKPLAVEQSKNLGVTTYEAAERFENRVTRKYVEKYGIDNVRGGNLTYRGKMIRRLGYFWRLEEWQELVLIVVVFLWIVASSAYIILDLVFRH